MAKETEKTYTKDQVQKLIAEVKTKNDELLRALEEKDSKIKSLYKDWSDMKGKEVDIQRRETVLEQNEQKCCDLQKKYSELKADVDAREITVAAQEKAFNKIKDELLKASDELAKQKTELFQQASKLAENYFDKMKAETDAHTAKLRADAQKDAAEIINRAEEAAKKQIDDNARLSGEKTQLYEQKAALEADKHALEEEIKRQKKEFDTTTADYAKTIAAFETLKVQLEANGKNVKEFSEEIAAMDTREQKLNARDNELNERERTLRFNETRNENKTKELDQRESDLLAEVEKKYPDIIADKDREIENLKREADSLRTSLKNSGSIVSQFKNLEAMFEGKNPAEFIAEYAKMKEEFAIALEKINNTPSYVLQKTAAELHEKENALNQRENDLAQKERESVVFHNACDQAKAEVEELKNKLDLEEKDRKILEEQLARLRATYENPAGEKERIRDINNPFISEPQPRMEKTDITEMGWLENIRKNINNSGLYFPRRIVNAFHTALKTSEMSPLTVLAGVSGTGKSELPRLYSRFGGINFLGVPVEPNWDCQEAMLGYYNSIDNCFEPTDLLRILAQSQRNTDDQNGLNDTMTMILLDEMNLANVELYFADFLSKLETRRGLADNDPAFPKIGVKIGSKMKDFPLRLGRNVLWTGTMNNDETTKTLSDKVIDRGILINFPRPEKLIRSRSEIVLAQPSPLLPRSVWDSWITGEKGAVKFSDEQIKDFKDTIEEINSQLGKTGRALGHRVWQSIESYMSLYPEVIAAKSDHEKEKAMKEAFEDQLVQKVMPKLRGLETRGTQGDALTAIQKIIPETLEEDFKNALEQNYGQFIWTTSGYLLKDDNNGDKN